jgi:hypothetical protein
VLTNKSDWWVKFEVIGDWRSWLSEEEDINRAETIRRNTYKGLPTGSEEFVKSLEIVTRRILQYRPVGRPKKVEK